MSSVTNELSVDERGDEAPDGTSDFLAESSADDSTGRSVGLRARRNVRPPLVSRWDRPPEPHDWRYYVGTVGKVLIATGLLMFGFVAYQLWGTGIETARAQNRLEDRFDTLVAENAADVVEAPPATGAPPAIDAPPTTDAPPTAGDDVPSIVPGAVDLSGDAAEQSPIPQPIRGEPLLRLEIPAIGRDDIVVPGVTLNDLKNGPGHYPDTPLPGQLGNAAVAGHRTTYGAPFFDVDQLETGDEIITTLLNGDRFVYEVTFIEVVSATDYWVVTTRDPNIAELTLTSCDPKYTARDRIVVHSVLNPEKSSNVGFPTFYALDEVEDADPIPGDDPVLSADVEVTEPEPALGGLDEQTADPSADATAETTGDAAGDLEPEFAADSDDQPRPATDEELDAARAATADANPVDAFSQGWFEDRDAFSQIALWGAVLSIISLLAYRLAKRYRRSSLGVLVGIVPFVVALYFFYQNVNRLLPPGI